MSKTCILTDETAQFLDLSFAGQEHVQLMPVQIDFSRAKSSEDGELRAHHFPQTRSAAPRPALTAPTVEEYVQVYANLSRRYSNIVAILPASGLTRSFANAHEAAERMRGKCHVSLVDTGALGIGLGILTAAAAERAAAGEPAGEIKKELMGLSNRVYATFCIRNLAYLEKTGLVSPGQALIGELLDVHQMYYLNSGTLVPVQKIRNSRHMVESVLEFVAEFDDPRNVALQQSASGYQQEARTIRERLMLEYPDLNISEMSLSLPLGTLLGPQSFGLYLWEI